jgi:hypothetical protein
VASTFSRCTSRSTASSGTRASRLTTRNSQRSRTLCEASSSGGRQRRRQRRRARSDQGRRTRARRLRFVAPQHRLSPHRVLAGQRPHTTPSSPATVATAAGGSPSVPRHQGRSRLGSMPVRPQFSVTDETERRRSQPRALSSWRQVCVLESRSLEV